MATMVPAIASAATAPETTQIAFQAESSRPASASSVSLSRRSCRSGLQGDGATENGGADAVHVGSFRWSGGGREELEDGGVIVMRMIGRSETATGQPMLEVTRSAASLSSAATCPASLLQAARSWLRSPTRASGETHHARHLDQGGHVDLVAEASEGVPLGDSTELGDWYSRRMRLNTHESETLART